VVVKCFPAHHWKKGKIRKRRKVTLWSLSILPFAAGGKARSPVNWYKGRRNRKYPFGFPDGQSTFHRLFLSFCSESYFESVRTKSLGTFKPIKKLSLKVLCCHSFIISKEQSRHLEEEGVRSSQLERHVMDVSIEVGHCRMSIQILSLQKNYCYHDGNDPSFRSCDEN
jgi:hypothetical protein